MMNRFFYFLLLVRGGKEGIVKHMSLILAKLQSPSNSPFLRPFENKRP